MTDAAPIYRQEGDLWIPGPEAKGPFPGQHGGAVAAVLAGCMETEASRIGAGKALQCSTLLLRPAPLEPCRISVSTVRDGGRVTVLEASLRAGEKECARAQSIFVREQDIGAWPLPARPVHEPLDAPVAPFGHYGHSPWYGDTVEFRYADGTHWLRSLRPVMQNCTALARVCAHADWASGLSRPDSRDEPRIGGFPNADLSIHLAREPQGEWVGLRPRSTWYQNGMGMTDTEILDIHGAVGRACHTIVLVPLSPKGA